MSLVQALAIAAAAFVMSQTLDHRVPPFAYPQAADRAERFAARAERAIERAQFAEMRAATWDYDDEMNPGACESVPKRGRL